MTKIKEYTLLFFYGILYIVYNREVYVMFCNNCGNQNNVGDMYCRTCGAPLNQNNINPINNQVNMNNFQSIPVYNQVPVQNINKKSNTNIIVIVVVALVVLAVGAYFYTSSSTSSILTGTWDCKSSVSGNYIVTAKFEKNKKFVWSKYGDEPNNHVKGKYTAVKKDKSNAYPNVKYFTITLNGEEYIYNGAVQDKDYNSTYEAGLSTASSGETQMALANPTTGSMFYCYKR